MLFNNGVLLAKKISLPEIWKKFFSKHWSKISRCLYSQLLALKVYRWEIKTWFWFSSSNSWFLFFIPVIIDISSYKIQSVTLRKNSCKALISTLWRFYRLKLGMILKKSNLWNRKLRIFHLLTSASRVYFLLGKSATSMANLKPMLIEVHLLLYF